MVETSSQAARLRPVLYGCKGCGSMVVEAALAMAGIDYAYEEVNYDADSPTRPLLLRVNPLGQVPVLRLPDGTLLTESFAMIGWIDDQAPAARLVPTPAEATRAMYLRWSVFLVAALYPTFTYGDDPSRWVGPGDAADRLRASTDAQRINLLRQMEDAAGAPWFLGDRFSAIDLYLAVMSWWRPGRDWFATNAPKLFAAANHAGQMPPVARMFRERMA